MLNKGLSNYVTFRPIKSGATVPLKEVFTWKWSELCRNVVWKSETATFRHFFQVNYAAILYLVSIYRQSAVKR
jgi:hypothetical protein